ncbi:MAG: GTP-binding protein [Promethearchaeota archaeon]
MKRSDDEIIATITTKVKEKLDFEQIANNHAEVFYNPTKFPGLAIQIENPKATVVLYSTKKIVIAGLMQISEVDQVVEKIKKILREEGIELTDPEIHIENLKPIILKICLLGDKGVGKTTLMNHFLEDSKNRKFQDKKEIIGVNFFETTTTDIEGRKVIMQLWNIIDNEKFKNIQRHYLKGAKAGIIVYDITNKSSFKSIDDYISMFRKSKRNRDLPIILIGNKIDLKDNREIINTQGSQMAITRKLAGYFECSATDAKGVKKIFDLISQTLFRGVYLNTISKALENELTLRILINLNMFKELSLSELSKHVHKSKATLSRHTRKLIKLGLIETTIKDIKPQAGTINKQYYSLKKELSYHLGKEHFNFINMKSKVKWETFNEFYIKKLFTFNSINLISKRLNDMVLDFSNKIFTGYPPLVKEFGKYLEHLPINMHYLNEKQYKKVQVLIGDFNLNLNKILAEDDASTKCYLLANMILPIIDTINLFDKPNMFYQIVLRRQLKKQEK